MCELGARPGKSDDDHIVPSVRTPSVRGLSEPKPRSSGVLNDSFEYATVTDATGG